MTSHSRIQGVHNATYSLSRVRLSVTCAEIISFTELHIICFFSGKDESRVNYISYLFIYSVVFPHIASHSYSFRRGHPVVLSIILKWNKTQLLQEIIIKKYIIVNGIPWHWRTIHCIHRHLSFYKYFGLMMACIDRSKSPLFKLINYKIVVFDEVYILFHFNITLIVADMGTRWQ